MLLPEGQDLTETESQPKITFTGNEEVEEDNTVGKYEPEVDHFRLKSIIDDDTYIFYLLIFFEILSIFFFSV